MRSLGFLIMLLVSACSGSMSTIQKASNNLVDEVGCSTSSSKLFDVLLAGLEEEKKLLNSKDIKDFIFNRIKEKWINLTPEQIEKLNTAILEFYNNTYHILRNEKFETLQESLAAFELGIVDGVNLGKHSKSIQKKSKEIYLLAQELSIPCNSTTPNPPDVNINPVQFGSFYTLAVTYQSCETLNKVPLDDSIENVRGIKITGTHPDGVGQKREIANLSEVQRSHHYLKNINYDNGCFRVSDNPLIYDYGGKPYTTASEPKMLDFFKNAGSGTDVLGVDCSAFVFSAIAAGGGKVSSNSEMKASLVHGINSTAFMNPSNNGMDCLEYPKYGYNEGSIKEGDIVAMSGHVFIIDEIGEDPFGYYKFTKSSECSSLTYKDFDFIIAQSSPSKDGIGIGRSYSEPYLRINPTFRQGLEHYAKESCLMYFNRTDSSIAHNKMRIVRHKNTPSCKTTALNLKNESCVQSCFRN